MGTLFKAVLGFVIALSLSGKPLPFDASRALLAVKDDLRANGSKALLGESLLPHSGTETRAHRLHP